MDTPFDIPKCYLLGGCNASDVASKLWHYVDWAKVIHAVKSLQIRLAQAATAEKWAKVTRLQWLVNHSFASKLLAVRRVSENKGKRTAGIDGQRWLEAKDKV